MAKAKARPSASIRDGEPKRKRGRPSNYSIALTDEICRRLASGESLVRMCRDAWMPNVTVVYDWLTRHPEFANKYARARESQMEAMAEEILEISDDSEQDTFKDKDGNLKVDHEVVARSRLKVDTRKWLMSKLAPKKYGDKLDLSIDDMRPTTPEARRARIAELMAMGVVEKKPGDDSSAPGV